MRKMPRSIALVVSLLVLGPGCNGATDADDNHFRVTMRDGVEMELWGKADAYIFPNGYFAVELEDARLPPGVEYLRIELFRREGQVPREGVYRADHPDSGIMVLGTTVDEEGLHSIQVKSGYVMISEADSRHVRGVFSATGWYGAPESHVPIRLHGSFSGPVRIVD